MPSTQVSVPTSHMREVPFPVDLRRAHVAVRSAYTRPLDAFDAAEAQNIPSTSKPGCDGGTLGASWLWRHGRRHMAQSRPLQGAGMWAGAVAVAPVAVIFNALTLVTACGLAGIWESNAQRPRTPLGTREDVICKSIDQLDAMVTHYNRPEYIERISKRQLDPTPLLHVLQDTRESLQQFTQHPNLPDRLRKSHMIKARAARIAIKVNKLEAALGSFASSPPP